MNEEILSFIWRFQYFEKTSLLTDEGSDLSILRPGSKNSDSGPDFSDARITIDGVQWVGTIELHTKSSDWLRHSHDADKNYESVILHVVWQNDITIRRTNGTIIPTLSLEGRVPLSILNRYNQLIEHSEEIPCSDSFEAVDYIHKLSMLDRALLERLDKKALLVLDLLEDNKQDWEETCYQWIVQHFGFKLNAPSFLRLSKILPLKILLKHRDNLLQMEALLFGCAGLIPKNTEENTYPYTLHREFRFLAAKYQLNCMQTEEWKFLRLRPSGFPTVRISQLASLISEKQGLFSLLTNIKTLAQLHDLLNLHQSPYWQKHYLFSKESKSKVPAMGKDAAELIMINGIVPLLVAYSKFRRQPEHLDKTIIWLSEMKAEDNQITRKWKTLGIDISSAADSQALIEWFNNYCTPKRCLQCNIGTRLLRNG